MRSAVALDGVVVLVRDAFQRFDDRRADEQSEAGRRRPQGRAQRVRGRALGRELAGEARGEAEGHVWLERCFVLLMLVRRAGGVERASALRVQMDFCSVRGSVKPRLCVQITARANFERRELASCKTLASARLNVAV